MTTTAAKVVLPPPKQIRFVNNQGQPPSKRRRVNAACLTCRRRKTRCAGERPTCSTCTKNGHHCLGYEAKESSGPTTSRLRSDTGDVGDLSNEVDDDFVEEEDEDAEDRRAWKPAARGSRKRASFAESEDELKRHESVSSIASPRGRGAEHGNNEWDQGDTAHLPARGPPSRGNSYRRNSLYSDDGKSSSNRSPSHSHHHNDSRRVPYFRYFGPTAIVPGYKQMVVNLPVNRARRRSRGGSFSASPGSLMGHAFHDWSQADPFVESIEDIPTYDPNSAIPTPSLILDLVRTFFLRLGCNYPFLRQEKCLRMVQEKTLEPVLVDAMCALAARFSKFPLARDETDQVLPRSEYGHVFAQRAQNAIVDTFPCPSVASVQACLLIAYERFGAGQDSALWTYLGLAIRMGVDVGLGKHLGIKYDGASDPWYMRGWASRSSAGASGDESEHEGEDEEPTPEELQEAEQDRTDTFWAVFILDRIISSGTGRPVTFRDEDFELDLPEPTVDPSTGLPAPFPFFIRIIHLYGRVSNFFNNVKHAEDLTPDKMANLISMEGELTKLYQEQDPRLHFSVANFQEYAKADQGTIFILLHFWFHSLIISLHLPALLPFRNLTQLLPNSRELAISSAKTIVDILAFTELIDPKSFYGNPFTSQPIYIAACTFLMESMADSEPRTQGVGSGSGSGSGSGTIGSTPPLSSSHRETRAESGHSSHAKPAGSGVSKSGKHSLLASAANQSYQKCYMSLQQLHAYWAGVQYILTALDFRSKGIWDCETYTFDEYSNSGNGPRVVLSLTGTTNSPNSSLTVLYQNNLSVLPPMFQPATSTPTPTSATTPPGNMIYDPIRQSHDDRSSMLPPPYPQAPTSSVRSQIQSRAGRQSVSSVTSDPSSSSRPLFNHRLMSPDAVDARSPDNDHKTHLLAGISQGTSHASNLRHVAYTPPSQHPAAYEPSSAFPGESPASTLGESEGHHPHNNQHQQHAHQYQHQHHDSSHNGGNNDGYMAGVGGGGGHASDFAQSNYVSGPSPTSFLNSWPLDLVTFDSQIDIGGLNLPSDLPNEMMPPWLEYLPSDVLSVFESSISGANRDHMN